MTAVQAYRCDLCTTIYAGQDGNIIGLERSGAPGLDLYQRRPEESEVHICNRCLCGLKCIAMEVEEGAKLR